MSSGTPVPREDKVACPTPVPGEDMFSMPGAGAALGGSWQYGYFFSCKRAGICCALIPFDTVRCNHMAHKAKKRGGAGATV